MVPNFRNVFVLSCLGRRSRTTGPRPVRHYKFLESRTLVAQRHGVIPHETGIFSAVTFLELQTSHELHFALGRSVFETCVSATVIPGSINFI